MDKKKIPDRVVQIEKCMMIFQIDFSNARTDVLGDWLIKILS